MKEIKITPLEDFKKEVKEIVRLSEEMQKPIRRPIDLTDDDFCGCGAEDTRFNGCCKDCM